MKFSRFTRFLSASVLSLSLVSFQSCTSASEDEGELVDPFADVDWPDSFIPENVPGATTLLFGDGSDGSSIYPETYFDSGPGHVEFTFEGDGTGGGALIARGLPILELVPVGDSEDLRANPLRQGETVWTPPSASGDTIGPFDFTFQLPPVDDEGNPILVVPERQYKFRSVIMQFDTVLSGAGVNLYRGRFVYGTFSMTVGPLYGDDALDVDSNNTEITYALNDSPFVFTTAIPVEPEPEPEPGPDPDPVP